MKLIIDIDEEILTLIKAHGHLKCDDIDNVRFALEYGTPYDKVIDEVTELLENEWGYEGMREDVSRIMRGGANDEMGESTD